MTQNSEMSRKEESVKVTHKGRGDVEESEKYTEKKKKKKKKPNRK